MKWLCAVVAVVAVGVLDAAAQTQVGSSLTYQAELRSSGQPAAGPVDVRFRLYDAVSGGAQVGPQIDRPGVPLSQGRFTQEIDFGAGTFGQNARFLEIDVRNPAGSGVYVTLTPRQRVTPAPVAQFSIQAGNAATAASATNASNATQLNGQAGSFYQNAANLSGGTIPDARLTGTYSGLLTLNNTGNAFTGSFSGSGAGLTALNASSVGTGTLSAARLPVPLTLSGSSATHIFRGENASTLTGAAGVHGLSTAATGTTYGVVGQSAGSGGRGVYGIGGAYGGYFETDSGAGNAVFARATAVTGSTVGVFGRSDSTAGLGVFGIAAATSGTTYGVLGRSDSVSGTGVIGSAIAGTGNTRGVHGRVDSPGGTGVFGEATGTEGGAIGGSFVTNSRFGGAGVRAEAPSVNATASTYGVWAQSAGFFGVGVFGQTLGNHASAFGVQSGGNFAASGTKAFRIDHPDDPENRYLLHYCAESPEVINFYSGKVTLDGAGEAVVELPPYFAKINRDPRYMLTAMGAPMPMLHVAQEIDEIALSAGAGAEPGEAALTCSFRIAGGAPGARVSWEVKALRNDRWVQQHGAPVEVEKLEGEKGTYLHPDLFGQPPEKGMNVRTSRK